MLGNRVENGSCIGFGQAMSVLQVQTLQVGFLFLVEVFTLAPYRKMAKQSGKESIHLCDEKCLGDAQVSPKLQVQAGLIPVS